MNAPTPSGTEASVCADIAERQQLGAAKYGQTVAENPLTLQQWLQHAYEECLDQAVYLKRAIDDMQATAAHAVTIADRAVICDIESEGVMALQSDGRRLYDTRPMLSEHERSGPERDMAAEALIYAEQRGLIARNADAPHLVRILRRP